MACQDSIIEGIYKAVLELALQSQLSQQLKAKHANPAACKLVHDHATWKLVWEHREHPGYPRPDAQVVLRAGCAQPLDSPCHRSVKTGPKELLLLQNKLLEILAEDAGEKLTVADALVM